MSTEGYDISNRNGMVNTALLPRTFGFVKASQGVWFQDPTFAANIGGMRANGILCIPYAYLEPFSPPMAPQAGYLLEQVGKVGGLRPGEGLMLDWEDEPSPNDRSDLLAGALDAHGSLYRALGFKSWLYSNLDYLTRHNLYAQPELAAVCNLHLAWWGPGSPPSVPPWGISPMVQYTDKGSIPGVVGPCDLDRYAGTPAELAATGWGHVPDPLGGLPADPPPTIAVDVNGKAQDVPSGLLTVSRQALAIYWQLSTIAPTRPDQAAAVMQLKSNADAMLRTVGLLPGSRPTWP